MKRRLSVSRLDHGPAVLIAEGAMGETMQQDLTAFAPALVAMLGVVPWSAEYDDEARSITIARDLTKPPMPRR